MNSYKSTDCCDSYAAARSSASSCRCDIAKGLTQEWRGGGEARDFCERDASRPLHARLTNDISQLCPSLPRFAECVARRRPPQDDISSWPTFLPQGLPGSSRIYISLRYGGPSALIRDVLELVRVNEDEWRRRRRSRRKRAWEGRESQRWERKPMLLPESGHDRGPWIHTVRRE